jgi:hypothetical protein
MRISLPTGRSGRLLAAGLTGAAMLFIWFSAVAPLLDLYAENAETLAQRRVLYRRMVDLTDRLASLQAQAGPGVAAAVPVIDGATDAVAGAALQQSVQEMAARAGATLSSTEALPATPVQGYRRLGLRVSLNAPWPILIQLLQTIERSNPRMLVDDLQVHGLRMLTPLVDPPLDAGFTVLAFRADPKSVPAR